MDLGTLIARMRQGQTLKRIGRRPLAQFGTQTRPLIGATILPERPVRENAFRDEGVRYRTFVANAGTRYSPVQLKEGALVGSVLVELGESDIGSELTSREYDVLIELLGNNASMDAEAQIINFLDITINQALIQYNEMQRWMGLVRRMIERRGDNAYVEDIPVITPAGHMIYALLPWDHEDVDPFDDIGAACQVLRDKGFEPEEIWTRSQVPTLMSKNPNVKTRTGRITIVGGGGVPTIQGLGGRVTLDEINAQLQADNNPPLQVYDGRYNTEDASIPYIEDGAVVIIGRTDRREEILLDNNEIELLEGTLGYLAVGRAAGQSDPGRVIQAEHKTNKPPRIEAEGWQTSGPVFQEPEAWVTIRRTHLGA